MYSLQGKDASRPAGNWFQLFMVLFPKEYLPTSVIEGTIEGSIEVTGRRRRKRKKLLDDVWKTREYRKLKEEALDCTVWRSRFGRGHGPVVRETGRMLGIYFDIFPICLLTAIGLSPGGSSAHLHTNNT